MKEDIKLLKKEFEKIRSLGLVKSLREGSTGVGYTFETLLNKKEDQESKPDFKSVELKCKLGYTKSPLTLFNCIPKRNGESAIKYIFDNYGNFRYGNKYDYKLFERKIFSRYSISRNGYEFKLKVDYYHSEVILKSFHNGIFLENVCVWDFRELERKLKSKLSTLAIIEAYPYKRNDQMYYKYVKMNIYKLRGFFEFLNLIENDKIFVNFYIKNAFGNDGKLIIEDHGVAFRIKKDYIEELFYKIKK